MEKIALKNLKKNTRGGKGNTAVLAPVKCIFAKQFFLSGNRTFEKCEWFKICIYFAQIQ